MIKNAAAMTAHAESMSSVVNDLEVISVGDGLNGLNITRIAIAMHRKNSRGAWGNGGIDFGWIEIQRKWLDVNEDRGDVIPEQ